MQYEKIWEKTLSKDEKVRYEFSVGDKYIKLGIVTTCLYGIPLLFLFGIGVIPLAIGLFFYGYYAKRANAYAFTDKRVLIHRGLLSTNTISVDYDKITDVTVSEPFLDKLFTKTGHLAINTAGTSQNEIVLRHIATPYEVKKKLDEMR
jgi:uncharacterized membrane protein YdbT with pleckstrin-like domain